MCPEKPTNKTSNKQKVVILSQYYLPETGAPQNRLSHIAQGLISRGFDVRVLTGLPNYPLGKIYPGFKKGFVRKTNQNGVPVIHCWLFTTSSKKILLRLINYFSFVLSSGIIGTAVLPKHDYLVVESPPLFLSISAWWLSFIKGSKIILNVSDLYPDTAISLGMLDNKFLQQVFYKFEAWSYKIASRITGQTDGIVSSIRSRFPEKNVTLITNGIDTKRFRKVNNPEINKDPFIIGYAGIIGHAQNLTFVLEIAEKLLDNPLIVFHLYGEGPEKSLVKSWVKTNRLTNVHIYGHLSHDAVLLQMNTWSLGIVPLANTELMSGALPSKMFEVMGSGIPVFLCAPKGEASKLIEDAHAGIWVTPDNVDQAAQSIISLFGKKELLENLGRNGKKIVDEFYDRDKILEQFIDVLEEAK